jgi:glycosyltransferase involved in cell wall biosynthesis
VIGFPFALGPGSDKPFIEENMASEMVPESLNLLFLLPEFPWPPQDGMQKNDEMLIRHLARRGHRISIICWTARKAGLQLPEELRGQVRLLHWEPLRGGMVRQLLRIGAQNAMKRAGLGGRDPVARALGEWQGPGVAHAESLLAIPYLPHIPGPKVLSLLDPPSLRFRRFMERSRGVISWLANLAKWRAGLALERKGIASGAPIHFVSVPDAAYFQERWPQARALQIPICFSRDDFKGGSRELDARDPLFLSGDFRTPQLRDPLFRFLAGCWGPIRQRVPGLELMVVGKVAEGDPLEELLMASPGVQWLPFVKDYFQALDRSSVVLCLDGMGTGLKNRVVQAMAMGKLVIGSRFALEGIPAHPNCHALVFNRLEETVRMVPRVVQRMDRYGFIARRGAARVEAEFSLEKVGERWEQLYAALAREGHQDGVPEHA